MEKLNYSNPPNQSSSERRLLWKSAIKWPLYSVAITPVALAAAWTIGHGRSIRLDQFFGFLLASTLLLLWENLTNDLFDADTGVDEFKFHSLVNLFGSKKPVRNLAYIAFSGGITLTLFLAINSTKEVLFLVLICCLLGYLYQGPPFRLGYKGLGEPLCWLAFGPFGSAAALMAISPNTYSMSGIPWSTAIVISAGPSLATTLILFCSHFHQISEDSANGKKSPLVQMGSKKSATLIPLIIMIIFLLEIVPIINQSIPFTALLSLIGLPSGIKLINLLKCHHNHPDKISGCKFLAVRFQALNSFGFGFGMLIAPLFQLN